MIQLAASVEEYILLKKLRWVQMDFNQSASGKVDCYTQKLLVTTVKSYLRAMIALLVRLGPA